MIHGSTPSNSRWVIPPILKLWPLIELNFSKAHTWLHLARNHSHLIGDHSPSPVSKAKRGTLAGTQQFEARWWSKVKVGLQLQPVSIMETLSPLSLVLVCGRWMDVKAHLLAAIPHLTGAKRETWAAGSKEESIKSSQSLWEMRTDQQKEQAITCSSTKTLIVC